MTKKRSGGKLRTANTLFRQGKYGEAIVLYRELIRETPAFESILISNLKLAELRKDKASIGCASLRTKKYPLTAHAYLLSHEIYTVDIVVPVFNALSEVKKCLRSVLNNSLPYDIELIVVNDGSEPEVANWLTGFAELHDECRVVHNPENLGYTKSINIGFRASRADFVIALNSDAIVTQGWLQSLLRCAKSRPKIGIVGPLSNAASWQNVPELYDSDKQFAVNEVPADHSIGSFAALVHDVSLRKYPEVPFVNGFCFMVARKVIEKIGYFDETSFPRGYGEENDYCIRARKAGFTLAVADDAYVFHSKSASFGHKARRELAKQGSEKLKRKHGAKLVDRLAGAIRFSGELENVRNNVRYEIKRRVEQAQPPMERNGRLRVLFLLPVSGGGGGVHSIVQECLGMQRLGIAAKIAVPNKHLAKFHSSYDDIEFKESLFEAFEIDNLAAKCSTYDVVVGTIYTSIKLLKEVVVHCPNVTPAYYIQDYEPLFEVVGTAAWREARSSYTLVPGCILFAKTDWLCKKVQDEHGVKVHKVSPSLDHDVYFLDMARRISNLRNKTTIVSAMIRPKTPRRGAARTMALLRHLKKSQGDDLDVHIFGCDPDDPQFFQLPQDFSHTNHGVLSRPGVAGILQCTDWFLDLSDYQAFGRTGLEALACGSQVIMTKWGGVEEYAVTDNGWSGVYLVDPFDKNLHVTVENVLLANNKGLSSCLCAALQASSFSIRRAALSEICTFYNQRM